MTEEFENITVIDNGDKPPDYLSWIGEEHYWWPREYADECVETGVSRRVAKDVGKDIVPGKSRMGFVHAKAIVTVHAEGMTLRDLALELYGEQMSKLGYPFDLDDFDPADLELIAYQDGVEIRDGTSMYRLICLLQDADGRKELGALETKYELEFHPGVFAWAFLTGKQYVMPEGKEDVPAEVWEAGAEPVHDVYID